jgi:acyl-CoA reductase-like NAD-dependent aldehyde dehydrogenase
MSQPLDWNHFYNIINGEKVSTAATRHSINPSTLQLNPEVPVSTPEDVDKAVIGAITAGERWAEVPLIERQQAVLGFAEALKSQKSDFARQLVKEQGKPVSFDVFIKHKHHLID